MDLIGRDEEAAAVSAVVDAAAPGPRALLLLGEAGAGKTALLAFARAAGGRRVLAAQGCPAEAEQPLSGLHQLLRPLLDDLDGLAAHLRAAVLGAFGLAGSPEPAALRVAVLTLLAQVSERTPLLLLVDDVALMDRDSLDVLTFVLRRLTTERVAVLLAARGSVRPPGLDSTVPVLVLGPLTEQAAARLLDGLPGSPTGRARLDVLREAAGSPLALVELARAAAAVPPGGDSPRGVRIQEMFADRLRDLPAATRRLLVYAAAAEHEDLAATMAAAGVDDLAAWAPAERAGLLSIADGRVHFPHPLARRAAYAGAPAGDRAQVHSDLAAALTDDPARRAWHLAEAAVGPDEAVAAALEETVERARRRDGVHAAARALERAAERTPDPVRRARRYAKALTAAADLGDPAWVRELHGHVTRLTDDPAVLGVAAAGAGHALSLSGRQREAFSLLHNALRRPHDDGTTLALAEALAAVSIQSGLPEHRAPLAALLDRLDAIGARAAFRENLEVQSDPVAHAVRVARSPSAAVHRVLTGEAEVSRLLSLGSVAWFADESDTAVAAFRQALGQSHDPHAIGGVVGCVPALASALIATGHWSDADDLLAEYAAIAAVHRLSPLAVDVAALAAELAAARGTGPRALPCDRVPLDENLATHARLLRAAGVTALSEGDGESAYRHLRALFDDDGAPLHFVLSDRSVADLAAAARLAGRPEAAAAVVSAVRARHGDQPTTRMRLLLHHAVALAGEGTALSAETEREHRLAVIDPEAEQWPLDRARARLDYARWLRRRRRALEARPLLGAALDTFTRLGATPLAAAAATELRASGAAVTAAPRPAADPLGDLTPQQREIVRLAAQGLRNREIAEQLFLSPRTVGSHLHNAYPKLGISGRHQLRDVLGG
ncbi:helix-turn-helix transcriptional regulator [Actinokineospora pegani]|uniref:helix-turn-helix transcriptional regulator n=1 Tax=Actinokineospora pegani TaxID=2654637 RepID=UPI0018D31C42|nr:LuxR family transcriptional regulator [Actinokineospora pegani]